MTFMGIRPEEIGQSLLDDIKEFDGYPCWVVTNKLTPEEERRAEKRGARKRSRKKVKTRAARRIIPIHPDLWRLGFMDYIAYLRKNGYTRIFPNWRLMGDGTYSALTSDEFNDPTRFLDRLGLKTESKVLYSLRHSFRDVLRASVLTEAYQDYIMGHAAAGMAKQYGSKKLPPRLLDMFIGSVGYRGIDFSKIMDAPGVPAYREDRIPDPIRRRIVRAVERCERLMADAGWSEA
jgi:hypothetical protein